MRKAGNRVRVTVQLIDARDRPPRLGRALRPRARGHLRHPGRDDRGDRRDACPAASRPPRTTAPSASRPTTWRPTSACSPPRCCTTARSREDNAEAQRLLERAIALDPDYAHAHAWKACVLGQTWVYGLVRRPRRHLAAGGRRAARSRWRSTTTTATCTASWPRVQPDAQRSRQGGLPPGAGARAQSQLRPGRGAAGRAADLARAAGRRHRLDQEGDAPQPLPPRALLEPSRSRPATAPTNTPRPSRPSRGSRGPTTRTTPSSPPPSRRWATPSPPPRMPPKS